MADKAELVFSVDGDNGNEIIFSGRAFGADRSVSGEVVFYTGMVGYPEAFTDPSYTGQILVMTYPLIGNYGVPEESLCRFGLPENFESDRICIAGLVVSSYCETPSHYENTQTLRDWLIRNDVPAICDTDTRAITKLLREHGTVIGVLKTDGVPVDGDTGTPAEMCKATISEAVYYSCGIPDKPVAAVIDCGTKTSIIRGLLEMEINVVRVPYNQSIDEIECSGVLVSNGPGDPEQWTETIQTVKKVIDGDIPVLGICLGHQILALAAGASTEKMKYGHRSQNQPCLEQGADNPEFLLTSQNHGYQVKKDTIPAEWQICYTNVNDGSVEGIRHSGKPILGVQFHPEASPGPMDGDRIIRGFAEEVFTAYGKTKGSV